MASGFQPALRWKSYPLNVGSGVGSSGHQLGPGTQSSLIPFLVTFDANLDDTQECAFFPKTADRTLRLVSALHLRLQLAARATSAIEPCRTNLLYREI